MLRLVSFTNGTLCDSPTKMAPPYRWPRYYKGERSTVLLIVMFEYIIIIIIIIYFVKWQGHKKG